MRLVLDFETTSTADLRLTGAQAYAEHPDTRITVLCFAVDDEPVETWTGGPVPRRFMEAVRSGAVVVAHNYLFEFNVYHNKLVPEGWPPIPLRQWSCTMARAYVAGYPGALELAAKAARLTIQKDSGSRDLMLRMARPRATFPEVTWWHETSPDHFNRLCAYCATDVEAERALDKALPELSPRERRIFDADHALNQRGLHIDDQLVGCLRRLADDAVGELTQRLIQVTNGQVRTPNQVDRLKQWLTFHGVQMPDLRRGTVRAFLDRLDITGAPRTVLQARLDASRSSTAKLDAIRSARSSDGRVRGCFQYYGANRTGRWAGRRIQPQNFYRGSIPPADVPAALITVTRPWATPEDLETLYTDSAMGVVASCLRSTIMAAPGNLLVILDFSQIEARVLAWFAGERASLGCFRRGDDIYTDTARRIGSSSRQLGKVLVLACGFGMGAGRFQETAAGYNITLDFDTCRRLVSQWRTSNAAIVSSWWDCERAMHRCCNSVPGTEIRVRNVAFVRRPGAILLRLPSGRHLVYRRPSIQWNEDNQRYQFCYMGSGGGGWYLQRAWPGKIVENIVQAIARDVMADAMVELHQRGVPLVATVHDELVAEVAAQDADTTFALMQSVMQCPPVWGKDLPTDAQGFIAKRYQKK